MPASNDLLPLTPDMFTKASNTVASAFAGDPSLDYAFSRPEKKANLPHIIRYYLKLDYLGGASTFVTSPECEGVATWYRSPIKSSWWMKLRAGWFRLPFYGGLHYINYSRREDRFFESLKAKHAPDRYIYLALLAVAPQHQGKGYARRLLSHLQTMLDEHGLPGYLETQNLRNVNMYRKYGFALRESTHFPAGSPCEVYVMLRRASS